MTARGVDCRAQGEGQASIGVDCLMERRFANNGKGSIPYELLGRGRFIMSERQGFIPKLGTIDV